jgi:hypothetical protein
MLVVGDDAVAAEVEVTGTNSGPLSLGGMELPATGRQITGHSAYFTRVEDGKIIEFHGHPNAARVDDEARPYAGLKSSAQIFCARHSWRQEVPETSLRD